MLSIRKNSDACRMSDKKSWQWALELNSPEFGELATN
jgi:hypothetical protein